MAPRLLQLRTVLLVGASLGLIALGVSALGACLMPLQFEEEADAGIDRNYPPVIVSSTPAMPGFLTIETQQPDETYSLTIEDKDLADRLFVRVFRDYDPGDPSPPRLDAVVEPSGLRQRVAEFQTTAWCSQTTPGTRFVFEVLVADRDYLLPSQPPAYQAVPVGAEVSHGYWVITCQ